MSAEGTGHDKGRQLLPSSQDDLSEPEQHAKDFSFMQHLIDEMDRSNQRIDEFSHDQYDSTRSHKTDHHLFEMLYDDAWKSEESDGASLQEVPVDYLGENNDSGCDEAVSSAIAEVSKDFLSGLRATAAPGQYGESDESHISSDTDFKLITGMASYARYPETAAGLSDNDWNPYGTESDTNVSPHVSSHEGSGPKPADSRFSSGISFNPPLHSSDYNMNTPSTVVYSFPDPAGRMSDIEEQTERETAILLKPDITADFSTISHISEQTMSPPKSFRDPIKMSDLNRTMRDSQLETHYQTERMTVASQRDKQQNDASSKESLSDQEEKRMIASTSSTGYSSATSGVRNTEHHWGNKEIKSNPASCQYISVMDRAKLLGIPEDIIDGNAGRHDISHEEKEDDSKDKLSRKYYEASQDPVSDDDYLGQRVQKVLINTQHLEKQDRKMRAQVNAAVDYNMLQKDLQEIQDSLYRTLGPEARLGTGRPATGGDEQSKKKTPISSDNEADIIPSTTTTPERKKDKMAWDFAADLGYRQPGGLMGDISLETFTSASQRPSEDKKSYNSDGDETRTSGSSDKLEDHAAADLALAEMSEILGPPGSTGHSVRDVDQVLSNFRNQRREIESRYQQLNNQGLAEKVYRILTNQNPESQANGILSEVSAEEKEMKAQYALGVHQKAFNFSTNSVDVEESSHSLALPDDIRKRLDLSGLSSNDASRLGDKSSLYVPSTKGFTAFNDMTKFLSSQMARASERTFNHSMEMKVPPQVIQCYPLYTDNKNKEKTSDGDNREASGSSASTQPTTLSTGGAGNGLKEERLTEQMEGESQERASKFGTEPERPASTSSPKESVTGQQNQSNNSAQSPDDSDSSSGKRREKYRPYRPAGSRDVYYTESDAASVADSVTTIESTHIGSDDARGPPLPSSVLGNRRDPPNVVGIYGNRKQLSTVQEGEILPPIQEKSGLDEHEAESSPVIKRDQPSERLGVKGHSGNLLDGGDAAGRMRGDAGAGVSTAQKNSEGRQTGEKDDGISIGVRAEFTDTKINDPPAHSVAAARRNARWANRREEVQNDFQDTQPGPTYPDVNDNAGVWDNGRSDFSRQGYQSRQFQVDDFDSEVKGIGDRRSRDDFRLPTDAFMHADDRAAPGHNEEQDNEPLSVRIRMTYEDKASRQGTSRNYKYSLKQMERGERSYTTEDLGVPLLSTTEHYSSLRDRPYRNRYLDSEKPYSPQVRDLRSPRQQEMAEIGQQRSMPRSYSDETLHSPMRDARVSPAFHQALSPELRHAIESRSPLLSRNIERSLAQPPANYPEQQRRADGRFRDFSPPPTFLARERGQAREYEQNLTSSRRSPWSPTRQDVDHSWPPTQQPRSPSPSQQQGDLSGHLNQSASPTGSRTHITAERVGNEKLETSNRKTSSSPKRQVELTLENMSSDSDDTELDKEPISRRAQLLTQALTQEQEPDISPDINALWEQFKAVNESYDSSMNSSRMEAVADLLRNPSHHLITQYLKEREEYRIERQERAEVEREKRLKDQQQQFGMRQSSSEDDVNGSYAEFLAQKEEERMKRRMARKKKGKSGETSKSRTGVEESKPVTNAPDSLFSIPEDASFEQSPMKCSPSTKPQKQKVPRHQHVIDPNMSKLRDRIAKQRNKIDTNTLKELRGMEKLRKLEHLLSAKKHGEISDQTLEQQLEEISSTSTPGSDKSQDARDKNGSAYNITPISDDSTTAKDSSAEMHAWKAEKERRIKEMKALELEEKRGYRAAKSVRQRNHSGPKSLPTKSKSKGAHDDESQIRLLQLVKDGFLTPEEAYKIALDRAENVDSLFLEECLQSSLEDSNGSYSNGQLHKLYSPYSRTDHFHTAKRRHVPKLKYTPSIHDVAAVTYPSTHQTHMRRRPSPKQAWIDHNNSQSSSTHIGHGYIRSKAAGTGQTKSRSPNFRERPVISVPTTPGSSRQDSRGPRHGSPSSCPNHQAISPSRQSNRSSPNRYTVSRFEQKISPSRPNSGVIRRPQSASPVRGDNRTSSRSKQMDRHSRRTGSGHSGRMKRNENEPPRRGSPKSGSVAWQIPFDSPPNTWKEPKSLLQQKVPLQERKSFSNMKRPKKIARSRVPFLDEGVEPLQGWEQRTEADEGIWHKAEHPPGIPQELWQHIVHNDALASKTNHWEVDPLMDRVQYILNKPTADSGTEEEKVKGREEDKPITKLSLQEAFMAHKQNFISKSRERQKRLALSRENRHLQECLRLEREAIFMDQEKSLDANRNAHPYSDNLYHPRRRFFSKQEMKDLTMKRYKTLPEVLHKKESDKRTAENRLNRLRVRIFNKKVQRDVLRKNTMRRR